MVRDCLLGHRRLIQPSQAVQSILADGEQKPKKTNQAEGKARRKMVQGSRGKEVQSKKLVARMRRPDLEGEEENVCQGEAISRNIPDKKKESPEPREKSGKPE